MIYKQIYHLYVKTPGTVNTSATGGIIEPGQVISLSGVVIGNDGGMPSPGIVPNTTAHGICVKISNNTELTMIDSTAVVLPVSIPNGSNLSLATALQCRINRVSTRLPAINGTPLTYPASLLLTAYSTRLMRIVPTFTTTQVTVTVQYPVQLAAVKGGRTALAGDHIPFAVCLHNIATIALGQEASKPRLVKLKIEIANMSSVRMKSGILFHTSKHTKSKVSQPDDKVYCLGKGPILVDFPLIAGSQKESFFGTLRCTSGSVLPYTALEIEVKLLLGDIDDPMNVSNMFVAQRAVHTLQLAEECGSFEDTFKGALVKGDDDEETETDFGAEEGVATVSKGPVSGDNMLLVVNGSTTRDEIDTWRQFASILHMNILCYDASYYNGFGYNMEVVNVLGEMRNGIVIILNNGYYRNDDPAYFNNHFHVDQFLRTSVIFEAARRRSVRTFVINGNKGLDMRLLAYPSETFVNVQPHSSRSSFTKATVEAPFVENSECLKAEHDLISVSGKHVFFQPSEKKLTRKSDGLEVALNKARPDRTYFTIDTFEKQKISTSFLFIQKYRLGTIECRRGLDTTNALIGLWNLQLGAGPAAQLYFVAMKLLPFEKKLAVLCASPGKTVPHLDILIDATLSDIADEVSLYVLHKRDYLMSGIPSSQLPTCMLKLKLFATQNYPEGLYPTLLLMTKRLQTLFLRMRTKWGMTHPYATYLCDTLYAMISRLFPEQSSSKKMASNFLANTVSTEASSFSPPASPKSPTSPTSAKTKMGVRSSLRAMRDPYGVVASSALQFNNTVEIENDPPVRAVDGKPGLGKPMFKFNTEADRVFGVVEFMEKAGAVSTQYGRVVHTGTE